jgi:hypothetical protein
MPGSFAAGLVGRSAIAAEEANRPQNLRSQVIITHHRFEKVDGRGDDARTKG